MCNLESVVQTASYDPYYGEPDRDGDQGYEIRPDGSVSMEIQGEMGFLHITRELKTLTRGEVALLAALMREKFGEKLAMDAGGRIDSESQAMQEELIDRMLGSVQQIRLVDRLVGIREEDHGSGGGE